MYKIYGRSSPTPAHEKGNYRKKAEALANFQVIVVRESELQPSTIAPPDLETPMDVVSFSLSFVMIFNLTCCRTMLSLNYGHQAGLINIFISLHTTKMELPYQNPDIGDVLDLIKINYQLNPLLLRPLQQFLTLRPSKVPKYIILLHMKILRSLSNLCPIIWSLSSLSRRLSTIHA